MSTNNSNFGFGAAAYTLPENAIAEEYQDEPWLKPLIQQTKWRLSSQETILSVILDSLRGLSIKEREQVIKEAKSLNEKELKDLAENLSSETLEELQVLVDKNLEK